MKYRITVMLLLVAVMLSGCIFGTEEPYEFRQEFDQITTIEILKKEHDSINADTPMDVIKTIEPDEHRALVDSLLKMEGGRVGMDPGTGFGMYIIRITYQNGEMEMLGDYNNGYISPNGELFQDVYAFDSEEYYELISTLLGEEVTDYTYG